MEDTIDHRPSKRLKITSEQNYCSTFECLSGDLILDLFEYFNTKEILQSFSNLTPLITSCIFDQRQQLHLHLDQQMPFLPGIYSIDQVISLHIEHVVIPIGIFSNLKSLSIVHGDRRDKEYLNMINEIHKLTQLVNFTLSLVGSELTSIDHKMITTSLCHSSLQRIILSKTTKPHQFSWLRKAPVKLIVPSVKDVYVTYDFHGVKTNKLIYKVGNSVPVPITPQYHVRYLDLEFNDWRLRFLADLLSSLPLLVTLKVKGRGYMYFWLVIDSWHSMLQNLKALRFVDIDIYTLMPFILRTEMVKRFNEAAAQKIDTCKRINLTASRRTKRPGEGYIQISASLNMN